MKTFRVLIASLVFVAPLAGLRAQESTPARELASNYQLADASGERKCPILLEARTAPGGFALTYDRATCRRLFPHLAEVTGWQPAPAGGINFVTAKGVAITEFTEGVGGNYEAIRENDGVYFLTNLRIADTSEVKADDLAGEWNLSRPEGPTICKISLTKDVAGTNRFAIRVAPGCDAAIVAFGPVSWQLSNGDVILFSKDEEAIRLGKNWEGVWARIPDQKNPRPRPLQMTR